MRFDEPARIAAAGGLLALALVALVSWEGRARAAGREVALPMEAVDPRGVLTGHYAQLQLRDRLAPGEPCPPEVGDAPEDLFGGERRGWVALRRGPQGWTVAGSAVTRAGAARLGPVAVRGSARCLPGMDIVELDIGITRFHAGQAEAEAMERAMRARTPGEPARDFAILSVGRDGRARLKGVEVNGRRIELDWF